MRLRRRDELIGGVIFDVDGVLLDTMPYWHSCGERFLATLGIEAEPGLGDRLFAETPITGAHYLKEHYHLPMTEEEVRAGTNRAMQEAYESLAGLKPGARELLNRFAEAGIPMTVASSTDRPYLETAFERLGIGDYFLRVLSCGELQTTKASPKIFYAAADIMGLDCPQVFVFEDGLYSIRTAAAAGFHTVGVYDAASEADQEEIMRVADFYYRSLTDFELI